MVRGRIIAEYRASYDVLVEGQVYTASLRGHFHDGLPTHFPKVGDYVIVTHLTAGKVVIESVVDRLNVVVRRSSHDGTLQPMVANVDTILIVMGLDADFNIPRLERYLALAVQSGVRPVVLLNKCDLTNQAEEQRATALKAANGAVVLLISATTGAGLEELTPYITAGQTVVLLGSSGAGKSTLTNRLVAAASQPTNTLRERDGRGRHTTTHRELFILPTDGFLIDTPGLRELALVSDTEAATAVFTDIDALATQCRFNNCDHEKSEGCALQAALQAGTLSTERFARYQKLRFGRERLRRTRY